MFSSHIKDINWQSDTMGIYYADVKAFGIFDLRNVDENFVPKPFEYVSSAEECANKPGTFFSDKKRIYVHTLDQKSPDDLNYVVGGDIALIKASLFEQSAVYLENCSFIGTHDSQLTDIRSNSENESIFVANRCRFIGGNQIPLDTQTGNALAVRSVKTTMMFNCIAAYSPRDGFNYHYNEIQEDKRRECLVVEYKCLAYNNGLISDILSSNATTAHEGICILRVGSVGYNTKGPVLADVNGCYSISIACKMSNSVTDNDGSFFFSNTGTPPKSGKAVLIDCVSDSSPYDINGDTEIEIILSNFTGSKTKEGLNITHIE